MRLKKRVLVFSLTLLILAGLSFGAIKVAWQDGAPLWWVLRGRHFERASIRWNKKLFQVDDRVAIAKLETGIRQGQSPLPYPTRCLAEEPTDWSLTLYDSNSRSFVVEAGLDGCGIFYVPSLDASYHSNPDLIPLVNEALGRPSTASPFQ